jgi:hypothetical protein
LGRFVGCQPFGLWKYAHLLFRGVFVLAVSGHRTTS